jgi:hypothetical protein
MAKTNKPKSIDELLAAANAEAAGEALEPETPQEVAEAVAANVPAQATTARRIRILMADHTDGKAKKTWKEGSVLEVGVHIDQYTAQRMIDAGWAAPTTADVKEILLEYKGKK